MDEHLAASDLCKPEMDIASAGYPRGEDDGTKYKSETWERRGRAKSLMGRDCVG